MPEERYEDPEDIYRFLRDEEDSGNSPDFQSEDGLPVIPLTRFGQHLLRSLRTHGSPWLIGFPNADAVERFAGWICQQPLGGDRPMDVFVLNRPRLPISSTNQGLHISFNGTVTVPTDRPIVLIVHDFGYLHNTAQRMFRHLVDGDGCIDTPLAQGSLLIGTFIQGQHGWIDPGFGGSRCLIKDA